MDAHFSAEQHFRLGEAELEGARHDAALEHFRAAHRLEPASARFRSFYGLCLGLAESRFDRALELCRAAAKEEFFNPVLTTWRASTSPSASRQSDPICAPGISTGNAASANCASGHARRRCSASAPAPPSQLLVRRGPGGRPMKRRAGAPSVSRLG
jgi:hypothetical protein